MLMSYLIAAHDGTEDNQRQGRLGKILHDFSKWMIRKAVRKIRKKMQPVIEYKHKTGWNEPMIAQLEKDFNWVISLDELQVNKGIGGFKGPEDKNRMLFEDLRDIMLVQLDEDPHYLIRVAALLFRINQNWAEYEQACRAGYELVNFPNIYAHLLELNAPLPVDDGSIPEDKFKV